MAYATTTQLATETTARKAGDALGITNATVEIAARKAGDVLLQAALDALTLRVVALEAAVTASISAWMAAAPASSLDADGTADLTPGVYLVSATE